MAVTEATVVDTRLKGNEYGVIELSFDIKMLDEFLGLLNSNKIRSPNGDFLTFRVQESEGYPGKGMLVVSSMHFPEEVTE